MLTDIEIFTPGRLLIVGDHSDWAGGYGKQPTHAVLTGINQGIYAIANQSDSLIFNNTTFKKEKTFLQKLAKEGGYYSYIAGTFLQLMDIGGINIQIEKMDLPMKKGLASSAAICVLIVEAYNKVYNLNYNLKTIMNIAYLGEAETPSKGGRGDQICAAGQRPAFMSFCNNDIAIQPILVPSEFYFLIVDLNAKKDTIKILNDLNKAYLEEHEDIISFIHENNEYFSSQAKFALQNGYSQVLGAIMNDSRECFDRKVAKYCVSELTSPVLHSLVDDNNIKDYYYGCKGVGSQGDGSMQFLCKDLETQQLLQKYLKEEKGMDSYPFILNP